MKWKRKKTVPITEALRNASDALQKALPVLAAVHFDGVKKMSETAVAMEGIGDDQKRAFDEKMKRLQEKFDTMVERFSK